MDKQKQRSLIRRYVVAVLAPAFVAVVMQLTWPFFQGSLASPYLLAVLFCAWYGGLGPGLVSVLVSLLVADYFFIVPYFSLGGPTHSDFVQLLVLAIVGLCTSILSELTRKAKQLAEINLAATKESEDRFRSLVAVTSQVVWAAGPEGNITADVPAWRNITGQSLEEIMGAGWLNAVHPSDRERVEQAWAAGVRQKKSYQTQGRIRQQDGSYRYYSIRGVPVFEENGTTVQEWVDAAKDITERRRAEAGLRESEERYRELFENAREALYVHDLSGRYTSFNRAAEQLSGYTRDEIIGKHFSNFVAPAHLKHVRENFCKKLDDEGETTYEIDLITKDRRRVPVEVSSRLIFENGKPVGVQGVARDITDRKRADEARARFELIVESSDDAIIGKTLDGTIVSWNSGAEKIYGYSAREVIGCHISILVPPDRNDEVRRHLERIRRGESISHYETLGRRKDGKLINVSLTISPIRDAAKKIVGVSTIARDVTKSKQAEKALQTFSRRLIEAQEAERQSIARELHDEIGQVLTAVRINLQSLQRSGPALQASPIEESLSIVDEALDRVRELSLNLRPSVLDNLGLSSALRWYVDRYARRSGIVADLSSEIEDGLRLRVEVETACFRIVQEALTNVARHAQATQVSVRLRRSNGNLELKIHDNGVGFNVDALLKDSPPAWALGLRGMEERAVAAQGSFKIDSAPMRGTEVRASFPLKDGS
jgi:PAS domain S-box-containing protein